MEDVERQLIRRVAFMQDSDDVEGLKKLFKAGWHAWPPITPHIDTDNNELTKGQQCQLDIIKKQVNKKKISILQLLYLATFSILIKICDFIILMAI